MHWRIYGCGNHKLHVSLFFIIDLYNAFINFFLLQSICACFLFAIVNCNQMCPYLPANNQAFVDVVVIHNVTSTSLPKAFTIVQSCPAISIISKNCISMGEIFRPQSFGSFTLLEKMCGCLWFSLAQ